MGRKGFKRFTSPIKRFREFNPTFAGYAKIFADDLRAATIEIATLATNSDPLDRLPWIFFNESLRGFDQIRIECAAQTFVGSNQHDEITLVTSLVEERMMKVFGGLTGQIAENFVHLIRKRPRVDNAVLRALQLRSRNHLHGFSDLLRVLDRLNAPANV